MAVLHIGTETTLAEIEQASINNGDVAYIWLNDYSRKMVYDSTSTRIEDTTNHPYYLRPDDYGSAGVWIEQVGADQPEAWNGSQLRTGALTSSNWSDGVSGSKFDLDNELLAIKDSTFGDVGIQIGWISSAAKLNVKADADNFLQFNGTKLTWKAANTQLDNDGNLIATSATITGAITATSGNISGALIIGNTGSICTTNKSSYADTDAGFFLGYDTDDYKFNIGDSDSYLKWDGSVLSIKLASSQTFTLEGDDSSPAKIYFEGTSRSTSWGINSSGSIFEIMPDTANAVEFRIGYESLGLFGTGKVFSKIKLASYESCTMSAWYGQSYPQAIVSAYGTTSIAYCIMRTRVGSTNHDVILKDGNFGFFTDSEFGGGLRVIGIRDATTAPSSNPSNGVVLYAQSGELKVRDSSGNITTISPHASIYPHALSTSQWPRVQVEEHQDRHLRRYIAWGKIAELVQELAHSSGLLTAQDKVIIIEDI